MMRIPPHPDGHGGNQRAWHLLKAIASHGPVHLALVYPASDTAAAGVALDRAGTVATSISVHPCAAWDAASDRHRGLPWALGIWIDLLRIGSGDAPRLPRQELVKIALGLPRRQFDLLAACRLPVATIADAMISYGIIEARRRVVDIDDIMSQFRVRQLATEPAARTLPKRVARGLWHAGRKREIEGLRREEDRIAATWDAVGVCSSDDLETFEARVPAARLVRIPNVVDRPELSARAGTGFRLLFVGNLGFAPNVHGLTCFVEEVLPLVRAQLPAIEVEVVGMGATDAMRALLAQSAVTLSENVASVVPHYAAADAVIAPIFFGGGTRIKIIEAMAFGRPLVVTPLGAEGLDLVDGKHALMADDPAGLAAAVVRLAGEPGLAAMLAANARAWQQQRFGPAALDQGVTELLAIASR